VPPESAEEEIARLRVLLSGTAPTVADRVSVLGRLAELTMATYGPDSARGAADLCEEGLALVARDHPLYPKLLHARATAERLAASPGDSVEAAAEWDREAYAITLDRSPEDALFNTVGWADWAWNERLYAQAAEAYDQAHRALARLVVGRIDDLGERLRRLSDFARIAPRGAFAYLQEPGPDPIAAAVLLERAGELVARANPQRRELDRLRGAGHAGLAETYLAALTAMADAARASGPDQYANLSPAEQAARRHLVAVTGQIRALSGFERFAAPSRREDVLAAAAEIPLVYLAPTDRGTVLLVVDGRQCRFELTPVTEADLARAAAPFLGAEVGASAGDPRDALDTLLRWLGDHVTAFIVMVLGGDDRPFVLIPFNWYGLLPVGSGYSVQPGPDEDVVIHHFWFHPARVSLSQSARMWLDSKRRAGTREVTSALAVSNPWPLPAGFPRLRLGDAEADVLSTRLPTTRLTGPAARGRAVVAAMTTPAVLHFSCHGAMEPDLAYSGCLLLAGGEQLTVQTLNDTPDLQARIAVLSACRSAAAALNVTQPVSLPFAFLSSGVAAVVGTWWQVDEMATLLIVTAFYRALTDDGLNPRDALGEAKAWLSRSDAATLRDVLGDDILSHDEARPLREATGHQNPYAHPWYWSGFFLAGA
jgi:hypothetical protein